MVRDPNDRTLTLEDYIILSRSDPTKDGFVKIPLLGRIPVVKSDPPLKGRTVDVKATLVNYWIERDSECGEILYAEFIGDREENNGKVRTFLRPFRDSYRTNFTRDKLTRFYQGIFEELKYHEVVFTAKKNNTFDSIEGIQGPDGKGWFLL